MYSSGIQCEQFPKKRIRLHVGLSVFVQYENIVVTLNRTKLDDRHFCTVSSEFNIRTEYDKK